MAFFLNLKLLTYRHQAGFTKSKNGQKNFTYGRFGFNLLTSGKTDTAKSFDDKCYRNKGNAFENTLNTQSDIFK